MRAVRVDPIFTAIVFALLSITAHAATQRYSAQLKASAVVPPANSVATGTFTAAFDSETNAMTYTLKFEQLTGPATSAHIHGLADRGTNALVVLLIGDNPVSPVSGNVTLTAGQIKDLHANKLYVDVHAAANPGGEIRGQIVKGPSAAKNAGGGGMQK